MEKVLVESLTDLEVEFMRDDNGMMPSIRVYLGKGSPSAVRLVTATTSASLLLFDSAKSTVDTESSVSLSLGRSSLFMTTVLVDEAEYFLVFFQQRDSGCPFLAQRVQIVSWSPLEGQIVAQ